MPRMNRIRLANIGLDRCYVKDQIIDTHSSLDVLICAVNGTGKSTTIEWIFSVLLPRLSDFISGETAARRRLKDYTHSDYPSHIVIEWTEQEGSKNKFIITGVTMQKEGESMKRKYYTYEYPELITNEPTIDLILFEKDGPLPQKEFLRILGDQVKQSKQPFKTFEGVTEWTNQLIELNIDPVLFKFQAHMNQREGGDTRKFLDFTNESQFFKFLFKILNDFSDNSSIAEVKQAFTQFKEQSLTKLEINYLGELIERILPGLPLANDKDKIEKNIRNMKGNIDFLKSELEVIIKDNEKGLQKLQLQKEETINNKNEKESRVEYENNAKEYLEFNKNQLELKSIEKKKSALEEKIEELKILINFLAIQPKMVELHDKQTQLKAINDAMDEKKPLIDHLESIRYIIERQIRNSMNETVKRREKLKKESDKITKELTDYKATTKTQNKLIEQYRREILDLNNKIASDGKLTQDFAKRITAGQTPSQYIESENNQLELLKQNLEIIKEKLKQTKSKVSPIEDSKTQLNKDLKYAEDARNKIKVNLEKIAERYQDIIQSHIYKKTFPILVGEGLDYDFITLQKLQKIEEESAKTENRFNYLIYEKEKLLYIIKSYEKTGFFPCNPNAERILRLLQAKISKYKISLGWDYLKNLDISDQKKYATKFPIELNGIVVNSDNLVDIKEFISNNASLIQELHLDEPVIISPTSLFADLPHDTDLSIIINPPSPLDTEENQRKYVSLQHSQDKIEQECSETSVNWDNYKNLISLWRTFLNDYPQEQYRQEVDSEKQAIENINSITAQIKQTDVKLHELGQEINMLDGEKDNVSEKVTDLTGQIKQDERMADILDRINENKQGITKNQDLIEQARQEIALAEAEIERIEQDLENNAKERQSEDDYMQQMGHALTKYSTKYTDLNIPSEYVIETMKNPLEQNQQTYETYHKIYTEEIEKAGLLSKKESLSHSIEELNKIFIKFQTNYGRDPFKIFTSNAKYQSGNETDIQDLKGLEEDKRSELKEQFRKASTREKELNAAITATDETSFLQEIKIQYEKVIVSEDSINGELKLLSDLCHQLEEEIRDCTVLISKLEENSRIIDGNLYKAKSLKDTFSTLLNKIVELNHDLEASIERWARQEALTDFESQSKAIQKKIEEVSENYNLNRQKIDNFISTYSKLKEKLPPEIHKNQYNEFIDSITFQSFSELSSKHAFLVEAKKNLEFEYTRLRQRIDNISRVFKTNLEGAVQNIKDLKKEKLNVPTNPELADKSLITFTIKSYTDEDLTLLINNYFESKFGKMDEFPATITHESIMSEIFDDFMATYLKDPKFIFIGKSINPYLTIMEYLKTSGGEILTFTILLYVLVASNRMKNIYHSKHQKLGIPLILDNPLGSANRNDFIDAQIQLAQALEIQLIIFTSIENEQIYGKFSTIINMKAAQEGRDEKNQEYRILNFEGMNIHGTSVHPRKAPKTTTLLDFQDEN